MKAPTLALVTALTAILAPLTAVAADPGVFPQPTVIVQEVTTSRGDASTITIYLQGDRMKTISRSGDRVAERLVDFSSRTLWLIDPVQKKFSIQSFEDLVARQEEGWQKFRQLSSDEQNQRRALALALPPTQVEPTSEYETIAGFKARKYQVTVNDRQQEVWASADFRMPPVYDELEMLLIPFSGPIGDAIRHQRGKLSTIEGFHLRKIESKGPPADPYTETTNTLEIRVGADIPDSQMRIPAGYQKIDSGRPDNEDVARIRVPAPPIQRASTSDQQP